MLKRIKYSKGVISVNYRSWNKLGRNSSASITTLFLDCTAKRTVARFYSSGLPVVESLPQKQRGIDMTTIQIKNADSSEVDDIQNIVNTHGFGPLVEDGGDWVAVTPDNLNGKGMVDVENDLISEIGKNIGVSFK
jgi:hypothetical protein